MTYIAEMYESGLGVEIDLAEARRWYVMAMAIDEGLGSFEYRVERLDEYVMTSGDWYVHAGNRNCYIYTYASEAARSPGLILAKMTFDVYRSETGNALGIAMVNPFILLDSDRPVSVSVDGQRFDRAVDNIGLIVPGSNGTALTKAIRAGQSVTVSGTSPAGQAISVTYSAAGFTRAFNEMARLCNRPGILSWIQ